MKHILTVETLERRRFVVEAVSAEVAMAEMEQRLQSADDINAVLNEGELLHQTHRMNVAYAKTVRT